MICDIQYRDFGDLEREESENYFFENIFRGLALLPLGFKPV